MINELIKKKQNTFFSLLGFVKDWVDGDLLHYYAQ